MRRIALVGSLQTLPTNSFDGRHAACAGRSDFGKVEIAQENRSRLASGSPESLGSLVDTTPRSCGGDRAHTCVHVQLQYIEGQVLILMEGYTTSGCVAHGTLMDWEWQENSQVFDSGSLAETMDCVYGRVKNVWGCTRVVATLEFGFFLVLRGPLGRSFYDGDRGLDFNRSVIRDEGCTSWMDQPGLLYAFKIFLAMYHSWLTCLLYGRLFVFVVRRLFFLNYSGNTGNGLHDFGWQCLRVAAIASLTILKALRIDKPRSRQLVVVGRRRHQQCPRRCIPLNWSAIWMCALITGAHAIDVHQEICKSVPHAGVEPLRTRIDPEDVVEESFIDDIHIPLPTDENEALEMPPRHLWIGGDRARTIFQTITQEHPERATLDTYGLRNIYIGNRYTRIQGTRYEELLQRVAELWDAYARNHHMRVFVADPQPPDSPSGVLGLGCRVSNFRPRPCPCKATAT